MAKPNQPGVWGIDVGQCALKAIRVEMIDGKATATAFDYVEHPKILSQPDADADQLTREALDKFLSRNTLRGDVVAISVPGQGGLARFVKLPPVEEKKITDIVRFEAKQQIPFRLEEVVWDFQKIGSGQVTDGFAMETEIGLFAMKRDMVNRYLQHFKDVNVEVQITQLAPLALCNFLSYDLLNQGEGVQGKEDESGEEEAAGKKKCIVALDIGADNSNLVITDADRIIWQRPIPLGGNHFTRALTKDFKLTFAKAEHLKRNAVKSPELKKILASLKPVLNDFVGEVQRSLGYFTNTHRDAHIRYMVGLGNAFRLPGLQKFLSEKLQLEVRKLTKLERLTGDSVITAPQYTENVLSFAVAYGLALQGLKLARLHTNLLPQEIQVERLVRAKKPWAAAAAAVLVLGIGGLTACLAVEERKLNNPAMKTARDKSKAAVTIAKKWIDECKKIQEEIDRKTSDTFKMASGQAEQLNWSLLLQYINESLPRANGAHIDKDHLKRYFTIAAKDAYDKLTAGNPTGDDLQPDLTQVNIEAFLPLYVDNLPAYFDKVRADPGVDDLEGMDLDEKKLVKTEKDKLPKKGWVVELRGYTYFRPVKLDNNGKPMIDPDTTDYIRDGPRQFLKDTLIRNLSDGSRWAKDDAFKQIVKESVKQQKAFWDAKSKFFILPARFDFLGMQCDEKFFKALIVQDVLDNDTRLLDKKRDIIWKNVRFAFMFRYLRVPDPEPGKFALIGNSQLKALLENKEAKGGGGGGRGMNMPAMGAGGKPNRENVPVGGGGKEAAPQAAAQGKKAGASRADWKPLGDIFGGGKGAEAGKQKSAVERYEFVILLVWEEPLKSEKEAENAEETKE